MNVGGACKLSVLQIQYIFYIYSMKKFYPLLFSLFLGIVIGKAQYSVLYNFNGSNGEEPEGALTLSAGKLFGMTYYGGPNSNGNVFSIDTDGNNYKDLFDFNGTNGDNPTGNVIISEKNIRNDFSHPDSYRESVEIYNMLGGKVYSNQFTINNSPFTIDLNQSAGVYLYRVSGNDGSLVGEGKFVIQK